VSAARARLLDAVSPELRPFLTYSLALHLALALGAAKLAGLTASRGKSTVYTIDFVGGPSRIVTSAGPEAAAAAPPAAAAAPARPAPSRDFDEFGRRRGRKTFVLPRPSLLRGAQSSQPEPAATPAPPAAAAGGGDGGAPGDGGVSADMPNFPYPWYITRVRQMLWAQWQRRMPKEAGETVVVFSLLRDGRVVDLRTETSSGDSAFDLASLAAVQDAAPYPPLPPGFAEPFLKVHVTLRAQ
jgi:protein TonB